jgi:hypothetical protein
VVSSAPSATLPLLQPTASSGKKSCSPIEAQDHPLMKAKPSHLSSEAITKRNAANKRLSKRAEPATRLRLSAMGGADHF